LLAEAAQLLNNEPHAGEHFTDIEMRLIQARWLLALAELKMLNERLSRT
jgi:acyl carrier protein phosphodiesterase